MTVHRFFGFPFANGFLNLSNGVDLALFSNGFVLRSYGFAGANDFALRSYGFLARSNGFLAVRGASSRRNRAPGGPPNFGRSDGASAPATFKFTGRPRNFAPSSLAITSSRRRNGIET